MAPDAEVSPAEADAVADDDEPADGDGSADDDGEVKGDIEGELDVVGAAELEGNTPPSVGLGAASSVTTVPVSVPESAVHPASSNAAVARIPSFVTACFWGFMVSPWLAEVFTGAWAIVLVEMPRY